MGFITMNNKKCLNCKYYFYATEKSELYLSECHRHSPFKGVISYYGRDRTITEWPDVQPDDWCGEFELNSDEI